MKKLLKEKFLNLFLINVIFTACLIGISVVIKNQVNLYIRNLSTVASQLDTLKTALEQNVTANIANVNSQINLLNSSVNNLLWLGYLIIPLIYFLLFVMFQGSNFYFISKEKDIKKYLLRFLVATFPFYLIFLFVFVKLLNQLSEFSMVYAILELIILIVLPYFALSIYYNLNSLKNIKNSLKKLTFIVYYLPFLLLILFYFIFCFLIGIYILNFSLLWIIIFSLIQMIIISLMILLELKFSLILEK